MRTRLFAAVALGAISLWCAAAEPTKPPTSFENQERWGAPWLLTEPEYPKAARERGIAGYVDVEARIAGTGELKEVEVKPGSPAAEIFVPTVREAAGFWRLYAPLGDDCLPSSERVVTRVWFELDGAKPRIFISRGKREMKDVRSDLKPTSSNSPRYPRKMIDSGRNAYVFGRAEIDPAGNVVSTSATAFPRELAANLFEFERETRRALEDWKFPAAAEGAAGARFYCVDVVFRMWD